MVRTCRRAAFRGNRFVALVEVLSPMAVALFTRRRRVALAAAAAAVMAGAFCLPAPAHAITIEIDDVAPDRVERQRAFAEGALPLAGTPDLAQLNDRLAAKGLKSGGELFIRVFKAESELEVWMKKDGRFVLFATYPICHWAGTIGPKLREGDKQNPEGFYSVGPRQLHRVGRWPRSLNIGYPNSFDRAHGRTGSYILVHGGCSSAGCFAMTNAVMAEIFTLTEQALKAGQDRVDVHVFPFRMTDANLAQHAASPWHDFWLNLKEGYDAFQETNLPPKIGLCDRRYVVEAQRPGEVGAQGPLALCGALRAATVEPSFLSLASLPPDWPQPPSQEPLQPNLQSLHQPEEQLPRSEYSGKPLPPLPSLAEQSLWQLPRSSRRQRSPRLASLAAPILTPPCNVGLASCRKFLALNADRQLQFRGTARVSRSAAREISRALAGLSSAAPTTPRRTRR